MDVETRQERREARKSNGRKMRVSGASVKTVARIIQEKAVKAREKARRRNEK